MEVLRGTVYGSSLIGLFAVATEGFALVPPGAKARTFSDALGVELERAMVCNSRLLGLFCSGNSQGVLVPHNAEGALPVKHEKLEVRETALGNLILANDKGAAISSKLLKAKAEIEAFLGVKAEAATVAGSDLVGSLGVCNNRGVLLHPDVSNEEAERLEAILDVDADITTVNTGSPYVGSGVVANGKGAVVGMRSTIHEIVRIDEALS